MSKKDKLNPFSKAISIPFQDLFRFFKMIMLRGGQKYQVFSTIIISYAVYVMNVFTSFKYSIDFVLNNKSVFTNPFISNPNFNITRRLVSFTSNNSSMNTAFPSIGKFFLRMWNAFSRTMPRAIPSLRKFWLKWFVTKFTVNYFESFHIFNYMLLY